MKKLLATATVAGTVLTGVLLGAGTASAANPTKRCDPNPDRSCSLASGYFPGGTISIDIDAWLRPGAQDTYFTFTIGNCKGGAYANEPARSWTCTLPASFYTLTARASFDAPTWELGLRW
ncbi:hypothetical protein N8J89_11670 [Crossiella sp. CA-258035]|uniref:hypothetical protein n=1 Tax=Crossiella sp. CA-258035 TaxID=2981138 RepID=UPI0024BCC59C|nr:hypothetical protein [Crossiella sp. CA-258035]WHT21690.1 hypothetical protein N8J89_11670 [Crossiella sp. CA-258035]